MFDFLTRLGTELEFIYSLNATYGIRMYRYAGAYAVDADGVNHAKLIQHILDNAIDELGLDIKYTINYL